MWQAGVVVGEKYCTVELTNRPHGEVECEGECQGLKWTYGPWLVWFLFLFNLLHLSLLQVHLFRIMWRRRPDQTSQV